jgi:hypothetical protein
MTLHHEHKIVCVKQKFTCGTFPSDRVLDLTALLLYCISRKYRVLEDYCYVQP